jgi:hypothetical protein
VLSREQRAREQPAAPAAHPVQEARAPSGPWSQIPALRG